MIAWAVSWAPGVALAEAWERVNNAAININSSSSEYLEGRMNNRGPHGQVFVRGVEILQLF